MNKRLIPRRCGTGCWSNQFALTVRNRRLYFHFSSRFRFWWWNFFPFLTPESLLCLMDWQVEFNYKMAVCQLSPPLISYLPLRLSLLVFMIATELNKPFQFLERSVVVILVYNLACVWYIYIFCCCIYWISMHVFGFRGNAYENIVHYYFFYIPFMKYLSQ